MDGKMAYILTDIFHLIKFRPVVCVIGGTFAGNIKCCPDGHQIDANLSRDTFI